MIGNADWQFTQAGNYGRKHGMNLIELYGNEQNNGSTQDALEIILKRFKNVSR